LSTIDLDSIGLSLKGQLAKIISRLFHAKAQRKRKDAKGNSFASLRFLCAFA